MGTVHITLLRHGRSRADDEKVHEGRYDSPLTQMGFEQAQKRLEDFRAKGFRFDRIIASPLIRAKAVAEVMSEGLDVPMELDPDWMEMDNGGAAGLSWEQNQKRYPRPAFITPFTDIYGGGESRWEMYARAARAVQAVVRRGADKYLVVAHGGILNSALHTLIGSTPTVNHQGFWFAFADLGYASVMYDPEQHRWNLLEFQMGFNTHE